MLHTDNLNFSIVHGMPYLLLCHRLHADENDHRHVSSALLTLMPVYITFPGHWYTSVLYDYAILFHGLAWTPDKSVLKKYIIYV